jgi:Beta protein
MMFGPRHYVPVLKVKRAEKAALAVIGNTTPGAVTPLLEVVERKPDAHLSNHLDTTFDRLAESVAKTSRCFIDARELAPDGDAAAEAVFSRADAEGIDYVPVVGISRTVGNTPAFRHSENGIALRVTREDLEQGGLSAAIVTFLTANSRGPEHIDLIMDMGDVGQLIPVGVAALAKKLLASVPHHRTWRTFTLTGCAFPRSIALVARQSYGLVDRSEWVCWRDSLYAQRKTMVRLPTFSDCAIQHIEGVEGFDPRTMAASACARYAVGDHWLLVKGESTKKVRPTLQFPKIANRIVSNVHGRYYQGPTHCLGCENITNAALGAPKLGSLEAWRRIGFIHHLATVLQDLASLRWP